jgi:DNA-binding winged helix-turn-helix (wHTH) protein/hemoglobin-like flavoprotein
MKFSFDDCELDDETFELRRAGALVTVQPKVLDVLLHLVRHRDRVVTRQELLDQVWADVNVGDASLARAIREARKALGDDGDDQKIIKTIHGRGFRFVASEPGAAERAHAPRAPPMPVEQAPEHALLGRDEVIAHFSTTLESAAQGRGGAFMISGDPGIGKTHLLEHCADRARSGGALTLAGRCYEGAGSPAFWPWIQIFRGYFESDRALADSRDLRAELSEISRILPEVRTRFTGIPEPPALEWSESRFRMFDAASRVLLHTAKRTPVVVVIDDLHWADASSLALVQFLAREIRRSNVLLVCTYRDQAIASNERLEQAVGAVLREFAASAIRLDGLTVGQIGRFVQAKLGRAPSDATTTALAQRTGGNPLFLAHLVELMRAQSGTSPDLDFAALRLPSEMRDVIGRHVEMLTNECRKFLTVASVVGDEFLAGLVAGVGGLSAEEILAPLEEALENRVLRKVAQEAGRYEFVHTLIREALYERMPADERARVHASAGEALRRFYGDHDVLHAEELAYQFQRASPAARFEHAIRYATIAADRAFENAAYDKAAELYGSALETSTLASGDAASRRKLLLRLGSSLGRDGRLQDASHAFRSAGSLARPVPAGDPPPSSRLEPLLLKESFHTIVERAPSLTHRFYEILFGRFPEAKSLFVRNTPSKQERMLADALTAIIDHLEDAPWLESTLLKLGARHAEYGVTDEMYEWVGSCLMTTLAEFAGEQWTPRVSRAWTDAYAAISGLMLAGARSAVNRAQDKTTGVPRS